MREESEVIEKLFEIQEKGGPEDIDFVIEALYGGETRAIREMAIDTLIELGRRFPVAHKVAPLLRSDDAFTRNSAIEVLASTKSEETLRILAELIKDPDKEVRKYALDALGRMEGNGEVDRIIMLALDDPDPNVKFSACEYLGIRKCNEAEDKLISLLESEKSEYGVSVLLDTLTTLGSRKAVPMIKKRYGEFRDTEIGISFFKAISILQGELMCDDFPKFAEMYPEEVIEVLSAVEKIPCPRSVEDFIRGLGESKTVAFATEILSIARKIKSREITEIVVSSLPDDESIYSLIDDIEGTCEETGISEEAVLSLLSGGVAKKILGLRLAPFCPSGKISEVIVQLLSSPENEDISEECARALSKFPPEKLPGKIKDIFPNLNENEKVLLLSPSTAKIIGDDLLMREFDRTKNTKLKYKIFKVVPLPPEKIKKLAREGEEPLRTLARKFLQEQKGG